MTNSINILKDAFKKLKKYSDDTFVIKCNGILLEDDNLLDAFCEDVVMLKNAGVNIVLVHDGTSIVNSMMERFSLKGASANLTCTDQATVEIVEMILSGHVNKKIASKINLAGGSAIGISGKDGHFMVAKRSKIAKYDHNACNNVLHFGFLGELALMNPDILLVLEDSDLIPVISPIAIGEDNRTYKIDAHDIAGAISAVLSASKLIFMSDAPGITDSKGKIIPEINLDQANKMLNEYKKENSISAKLRAGVMAFEQNTDTVHIIDGKIPHSLILEIFTDNLVGTKIKGS
jgi:acetylglutamate kinase